MNQSRDQSSFWEKHRRLLLFAAAVLLGAALGTALYAAVTYRGKSVDHISAVYTGDTKAGVVLDDKNKGFTVTAVFKDGHEEVVTGWTVEAPQTLEDTKKSSVTITYKKASTRVEVQCTTGLIQSITAEYDGETTAGTQISDSNPGIHVFAIRDGQKAPLEKGWRVDNPSVLERDKLSTYTITYEGFSCSLSIQCTSKTIAKLSAVYTGSTEEGTVIGTGSEYITVTARYADNSMEQVSGWTAAETVTLAPKQRYILEIHYEDSMCTVEVTCTTPTPEEFKQGCISAGYFSLYHNPGHYSGVNIVVEGVITERTPKADGSVDVFLEMTGDILGITKGTLCAVYASTLHGELPRPGTRVKIYGMYKGVSARMVDGSSMSMPIMNAEYVVAQ